MSEDEVSRHANLLSAMGWDLRGLGEAQVRSLTAMQRCIEDFRKGDRDAVVGILRHMREIEDRSPQVAETLRELRAAIAVVAGEYQ